jgi:hypothetical protein
MWPDQKGNALVTIVVGQIDKLSSEAPHKLPATFVAVTIGSVTTSI